MTKEHLEARRRYIRERVKPDYWAFRSGVGVIVCIGAILLDFTVMKAFFTDLRDLNVIMSALGVLAAIDAIPLWLMPVYKRRYEKLERAPTWLLILAAVLIVATMAAVASVKLYAMERLNETRTVPITAPKILLETLIPVATSTLSALYAWCSYQPLKRAMMKLELRIAQCEFDLMEVTTRQAKYSACTEDYRAELELQAARKYLAARGRIDAVAADLRAYFCCRLAERLADPAPVNALASPHVVTPIHRLKLPPSVEIGDIYAEDQPPREPLAQPVDHNEMEVMEHENVA